MKLIGSGSEIRKNREKKRSLGKGVKWKKGRLKPVEAILICHDQKNVSCVFLSFVFFQFVPFFLFFCCNPMFFLFWGQQTYVGATRAFQPIAFMTWYHAHVLSHALSSAPATNWIRSVKPLPSHQWHLRFNDNNKALARKVELWWIIHPPKVPGDE